MSKYIVEIQETKSMKVELESDCPEQAIADVMIGYYECLYILDSNNYKNVEFKVVETIE